MENWNIPPCFYRLSVKALIHNKEGRILFVKESNQNWTLPGGGVDYGEDLHECLKREIKEEMGLEVESINNEPSYFYTSINLNGWNVAITLYETRVKNLDFIPSEECIEIGFFTLEETKKLQTYPNIQEFLKHYNPKNHFL